jgi:hypothetical protein
LRDEQYYDGDAENNRHLFSVHNGNPYPMK